MKRSGIVATALAAAVVLVGPLAAADGEALKLMSGSVASKGVAGILAGGGVTCVGGELNQKAPWPPCTPSTVTTRIRGWLMKGEVTGDSPLVGTRISVFNANLDKDGNGSMWGTIRFELSDPGQGARWGCGLMTPTCAFEGAYTGQWVGFVMTGAHMIGYGVQGAVEGMRVFADCTTDPASGLEVFNGYYYPPPKK